MRIFPRSRKEGACTLLLFLTIFVLAACGEAEDAHPENRDAPTAETRGTTVVQTDATRKMVRELQRLDEETKANPAAYYYMSLEHAALIKSEAGSRIESMPEPVRIAYARALLNGGDTKGAIEHIESLLSETSGSNGRDVRARRTLQELLALAYLRLGEQQNCIANPAAESCILPIRDAAVHRLPSGSRKAIDLYTRLLERYRTDYQSQWLLNVAYATLGRYPEDVPPHLLIPGLEADTTTSIHRFTNIAGALGVDVHGLAGGVAVEDFNEDGLLDIFATAHRINDRSRLFLNDGQGGFADYTREAGLTGVSGGLNVLHADYNNDGYEDVLILRGAWLGEAGQHPNSLLKNNGDGTFQDVTEEAGLLSYHPTQTAAWADFNGDGWLDLFVGNEEADHWLQAWQRASTSHATEDRRHPSELFVNNGNGTFTEIAGEVGIELEAFVKGTTWGDVNNDGLPDLYVSIIGSPNRLYMNRGAQDSDRWLFEEVAAGVHEPFFSFPTWFFDFDNDGWEDLFVAGYDLRRINDAAGDVAREYLGMSVETEMSRLFRNDGDGNFTDVTQEMGLAKVLFSMGSNFGDLDNDGYLDFYVGTGAPHLSAVIPSRMFHNLGGERFEEITFEGGFGHIQKGHGVAFADFDQDGDQDIYAAMGGAYDGDGYNNVLFENPGNLADNNWVVFQLEGRRSNRSAIGARIRVVVTDGGGIERNIYRTVSTGGSFGASSLQQEIGLGEATHIDEVQITWPNVERTVEVMSDLPVNHYYRIVEGRQAAEPVPTDVIPFRVDGREPHRHDGDAK